MTPADRRFTSWLLVGFGPLFVVGGFVASFTVEGAVLIFVGLAMLVTGALLFTPLRLVFAVATDVLLFAALTTQMIVDLPS